MQILLLGLSLVPVCRKSYRVTEGQRWGTTRFLRRPNEHRTIRGKTAMQKYEGEIDNLFDKMVKRGLVSTSHHWIERATEQKNPRLTLDLACSTLLVYDRVDKQLMTLKELN
jgi:hypothetical protein